MEAAEELKISDATFEQRRFEQMRRESAALNIGRTAVEGCERRRSDEIKSGLAEALSGRIDTHYEFELVGKKFVAEDGEPIEQLLLRGLQSDIKKASQDSFFNFLPKRSRAELDNFRILQRMANGEMDANTLLEESVYTEALDTSAENRQKLVEAAQKPYWGRTMVRVSHWDGRKLHIFTMSSDNLVAAENYEFIEEQSSMAIFKEATRRELGYEFSAKDSEELLAEPIALKMDGDSWKNLAVNIVTQADVILSERHGGSWKQGRPENETIDLQKYVESQTEVLQGLMRAERQTVMAYSAYETYQEAFNKELFNCIALLEARLKQGRFDETILDYEAASAGAGAIAQAEGRSYDMCGMIVGAQQANVAQQTGIESLSRLEGKNISCPECTKKVIVPKKDLEKGILTCNECGYWLDVCTGYKGFKKNDKKANSTIGQFGMFESFAEWWRREGANEQIRKAAVSRAKAELGDAAAYSDIKHYEKQIRRAEENRPV